MAVKTGGQRYFVEPDALGNVRALVNESGVRAQTYTYWPYGEVRTSSGTVEQPLKFCGTWGYYTESASKQYVRARYYMQSLGRWQTVDPLWPGELAYGYVAGVVMSYVDPLGLQSLPFSPSKPVQAQLPFGPPQMPSPLAPGWDCAHPPRPPVIPVRRPVPPLACSTSQGQPSPFDPTWAKWQRDVARYQDQLRQYNLRCRRVKQGCLECLGRIYKETGETHHGAKGTQNALRHCVGYCRAYKECNWLCATLINLHEWPFFVSLGMYNTDDTLCDFRNNDEGLDVARNSLACEEGCASKLRTGGLCID